MISPKDLKTSSSTPSMISHPRIIKTNQYGDSIPLEYIIVPTSRPDITHSTTQRISSFNLTDLHHKKYFLKRPILITIESEPDGYILSNNDVNVHAFGETIIEAEEEWKYILTNLYLSYRDTLDGQLTPGGKTLKEILESYVGER